MDGAGEEGGGKVIGEGGSERGREVWVLYEGGKGVGGGGGTHNVDHPTNWKVDEQQFRGGTAENSSLTKKILISYLPRIMCFGLPVSVSCPFGRKINDEECLPLVSVSKG